MNDGKKDILKDKSFLFAIRIANLCLFLNNERKEFVLSKQLLRSGTAVGALIRESKNAESKADFIHKLGIAQKECDETLYWLELLAGIKLINKVEYDSMSSDATGLLKMIRSSIITAKKNLYS
jgi:four helix bundle protein